MPSNPRTKRLSVVFRLLRLFLPCLLPLLAGCASQAPAGGSTGYYEGPMVPVKRNADDGGGQAAPAAPAGGAERQRSSGG